MPLAILDPDNILGDFVHLMEQEEKEMGNNKMNRGHLQVQFFTNTPARMRWKNPADAYG